MKTRYSIVIPVYNSVESVTELVDRIEAVFRNGSDAEHEVILIDDHSPNDGVWPNLQQLAARPNVKAIHLMRNFGKPGALVCGLAQASGDHIFTMDDDLQHRPEDMPLFFDQQHHDIVIGSISNKKHSIFKRVTSQWKSWLDQKLIGKPRGVYNSPYRLLSKHVVDSALQMQSPYPYISALLFYCSRDVVNVPITHDARKYGRTGYTFRRMIRHFSNLIINNSSLLLRAVSVLGMTVAALSGVGAVYLVYKKLAHGVSVMGWTSIMLTVLILGGFTLFAVGIIGEYLSRIITGVEKRPSYVIKDRVD